MEDAANYLARKLQEAENSLQAEQHFGGKWKQIALRLAKELNYTKEQYVELHKEALSF